MNDNNLNNNITPQPIPNPVPQTSVNPTPIPNTGLDSSQPVPMNNGVVTPQQPTKPTSNPVEQPVIVTTVQEPQPMANNIPNQSTVPPTIPEPNQVASQPVPQAPISNPVEQPVIVTTVQEPQPMANNIPNQNTVPPTSQEPNQVASQPVQQQEVPKQKSNPILIALMFVALIGGGIYFGYNKFFANSSSNNGNQNTGTTVTDNTNEEITNEEAIIIVKEVLKKYNQPYKVICGEMDYEDSIDESDKHYSASKTYTTIAEIDTYLATFLSHDFIKDNIDKTKYLEKDGKLYCNHPQSGTLIYNEEESTYTINELTSESIKVTGTVSYTIEGGATESYPLEVSLIKENNSWLLNNYKETR